MLLVMDMVMVMDMATAGESYSSDIKEMLI